MVAQYAPLPCLSLRMRPDDLFWLVDRGRSDSIVLNVDHKMLHLVLFTFLYCNHSYEKNLPWAAAVV